MFSSYAIIVIVGATLTFENELDKQGLGIGEARYLNKRAEDVGIDPRDAKCEAICNSDDYCFFFGVENDVCRTFKTFDSEVEFRLYARKPAATINLTSIQIGSQVPGGISLVGKESISIFNRGLYLAEVNPLLNKLENRQRFDIYHFGHQLINYITLIINIPDSMWTIWRGSSAYSSKYQFFSVEHFINEYISMTMAVKMNVAVGKIVVGATSDDATNSLHRDLLLANGMDFSQIRFRDPYAFLWQKGYPNKSITATKPAYTGKLSILARIYRPCFTSDPTHYVFARGHDLAEL